MICIFSITFVGKSSPVGPLDEVVTGLGTIPATCPSAHVIVFEIPPSFFKLVAPEVLSSYTGVAP
jgi:hypothetical protein